MGCCSPLRRGCTDENSCRSYWNRDVIKLSLWSDYFSISSSTNESSPRGRLDLYEVIHEVVAWNRSPCCHIQSSNSRRWLDSHKAGDCVAGRGSGSTREDILKLKRGLFDQRDQISSFGVVNRYRNLSLRNSYAIRLLLQRDHVGGHAKRVSTRFAYYASVSSLWPSRIPHRYSQVRAHAKYATVGPDEGGTAGEND